MAKEAADLEIAILGDGDAPLLREMLSVFSAAFEDPENYEQAQPCDAYLNALLGRDTFVAVAASMGGRMVGGIAGYVLPKFEQVRSELYIYDLGVLEPYRRRGIATAMIATLRTVAIERGAHVIYVQAAVGDAPAIALYDNLGTREEVLHFDIESRT